MTSLEWGISVAYPENDTYYKDHGYDIYRECIRQANIVIIYSKNVTDVLRAHMIMVLLHSAYGDIEQAKEHADNFPWRADMTIHEMYSYISHFEKDYQAEGIHCQRDFMYHFEAMLDIITQLGCTYEEQSKYSDALESYLTVLSLTDIVFGKEKMLPAMHCRERGDVYMLIAKVYVKTGDENKALDYLEKMVDYDINVRMLFNDDKVTTPLLRDVGYSWFPRHTIHGLKKRVLQKLNDKSFGKMSDKDRFKALFEKVNSLPD